MLAGNGTGGEGQFGGDRGFLAGNIPAGRPVQIENLLGVIVEFLSGSGKEDPAPPPLEQGFAGILTPSASPDKWEDNQGLTT